MKEYLYKEISFGAMFGPVKHLDYGHCLPILTKQKDLDKRRFMLHLSYTRAVSVNVSVNHLSFDPNAFALKLTSIDHTREREVILNTDYPMMFKVVAA